MKLTSWHRRPVPLSSYFLLPKYFAHFRLRNRSLLGRHHQSQLIFFSIILSIERTKVPCWTWNRWITKMSEDRRPLPISPCCSPAVTIHLICIFKFISSICIPTRLSYFKASSVANLHAKSQRIDEPFLCSSFAYGKSIFHHSIASFPPPPPFWEFSVGLNFDLIWLWNDKWTVNKAAVLPRSIKRKILKEIRSIISNNFFFNYRMLLFR